MGAKKDDPALIPLKKPDLRRCFNFPAHAAHVKYASFLENFAPCISGFLSGIRFRGFCNAIRTTSFTHADAN